MKEIIAIIRPRKMGPTKKALDEMGFPCMTALPVLGRGKQRGIAAEVGIDLRPTARAQGSCRAMKYIPKRLVSLVVPDEAVGMVVAAIIKINRTAQVGDGRIFVCPVEDALRVRTSEQGESAIL